MLVSAFNKAQDVTLKVVTDKIKEQLAENHLHAVGYEDIAPEPIANKAPVLEAVKSGKFTITFSYLQQLHRTKVYKVGAGFGTPIYKVALNSRLSKTSTICWLQNTPEQGWAMVLGNIDDAGLIKAIISAIESQE